MLPCGVNAVRLVSCYSSQNPFLYIFCFFWQRLSKPESFPLIVVAKPSHMTQHKNITHKRYTGVAVVRCSSLSGCLPGGGVSQVYKPSLFGRPLDRSHPSGVTSTIGGGTSFVLKPRWAACGPIMDRTDAAQRPETGGLWALQGPFCRLFRLMALYGPEPNQTGAGAGGPDMDLVT